MRPKRESVGWMLSAIRDYQRYENEMPLKQGEYGSCTLMWSDWTKNPIGTLQKWHTEGARYLGTPSHSLLQETGLRLPYWQKRIGMYISWRESCGVNENWMFCVMEEHCDWLISSILSRRTTRVLVVFFFVVGKVHGLQTYTLEVPAYQSRST